MCLLFETILIKNKKPQNLKFHNLRFNKSRYEVLGCTQQINLESYLDTRPLENERLYRCRITYDKEIKQIEFIPYTPSIIKTLQLVFCDDISYDYKFSDRTCFSELKKGIHADDILIVKNGWVTDISIANIIFKKNNQWFTPKSPLLQGTQREKLLQTQLVKTIDITIEDIKQFETFGLINALKPFEYLEEITIDNIKIQ